MPAVKNVKELRELQLRFAGDVFEGGDRGAGPHVRANGLTGARRLQVYRNNMYASLTQALKATYPVVHRLVGDGFFKHACTRYIGRHPSDSGNLHDFGELFAAFLAGFEPAARLPYLPDVAHLEWSWQRVYHAADAQPLDTGALAAVPPQRYETLRFRLNPASALLASDYPVLRIWEVNQEDYQGDPTVDLAEGGVKILVLRGFDDTIELQQLEQGEYALLNALAGNETFGASCDLALSAQPDFDVAGAFRRHVIRGTLIDFHLDE